jgi:hypothetical protein
MLEEQPPRPLDVYPVGQPALAAGFAVLFKPVDEGELAEGIAHPPMPFGA